MSDPKITIRVEGSGLPAGGNDGQVLSKQDGKPAWVDPPKSEDALPITGGTLKGDLNIGSTSETAGAQLRIAKQGADGKGYQMGSYISGGNMARTDYIANGAISNFMQLGPTETGFGKPVRVSSGGTGVTSYDELKEKLDVIPNLSTATVGQTIVVKSVGENGKPTEWEAADMASDGEQPDMREYVKYSGVNGKMTLEWDGNGEGLEKFMWGQMSMYKLSDDTPAFSSVTSVMSTRNGGIIRTELFEGVGCYRAGDTIVVLAPGKCSISSNGTVAPVSFVAPSAGIYFYSNDMAGVYQAELTMICDIPGTALTLKSTSGKQFRITVDDSGTLTATEVTK